MISKSSPLEQGKRILAKITESHHDEIVCEISPTKFAPLEFDPSNGQDGYENQTEFPYIEHVPVDRISDLSNELVNEYIKDPDKMLSKSQRKAIYESCTRKYSILRGPPGTGKSWTIACISQVLSERAKVFELESNRGYKKIAKSLKDEKARESFFENEFNSFLTNHNMGTVYHEAIFTALVRGTGSTLRPTLRLRYRKRAILICAKSNAALNNIMRYLDDLGLAFLRVGVAEKVPEDYQDCMFGEIFRSYESKYPDYLEHKEDYKEFRRYFQKTKGQSAYRIDLPEPYFDNIILEEASQIEETEVLIPLAKLASERTQIIMSGDENQLAPIWDSIHKGGKMFPYTTLFERSIRPFKDWYKFPCELTWNKQREMFPPCKIHISTLWDQFRMHPFLYKWASNYFYHSSISSNFFCQDIGDNKLGIKPFELIEWRHPDKPVLFLQTSDTRSSKDALDLLPLLNSELSKKDKEEFIKHFGGSTQKNSFHREIGGANMSGGIFAGTSYGNLREVALISLMLKQCLDAFQYEYIHRDHNNPRFYRIAVLTPYAFQKKLFYEYATQLFETYLTEDNFQDPIQAHDEVKSIAKINGQNFSITFATVDEYQGRESDLIIFSTTRNNMDKKIGFLGNKKRINVALTRAKQGLIVVGDRQTLEQDPVWANWFTQFLDYHPLTIVEDFVFNNKIVRPKYRAGKDTLLLREE